jgi:hypothetical protein
VGERQQSHYAKYEYPPDDSKTRSARGSAYMVNCKKTEDAESLGRCVCTLTSINRRDSVARRWTGSPLAWLLLLERWIDGIKETCELCDRRPYTSDACFRCAMEGRHGDGYEEF